MHCTASFTTEIIKFDNVNEIVNWLRQGNEARTILGDGVICRLKMNKVNGGIMAVEMTGDEHNVVDVGYWGLSVDELEDLEIVGVYYNNENDEHEDFSKFGIA